MTADFSSAVQLLAFYDKTEKLFFLPVQNLKNLQIPLGTQPIVGK